jgi:outer membrane receptor protein involved in Fe transport
VADEADFRFRRAATLYREGRLEEALGEFLASNRLVKNHNVAFNIARCFEQLKRFNEAYRWYNEILAEPGLPEEDRKAILAALARLGNSLALVRIESEPEGASVYIDRKDLGARGQTPVTLALRPGDARILLELDGYRPAQTSTTAETGKLADVNLRLSPILGTLHVEGEPARFDLRLDAPEAETALSAPGSLRTTPGLHRLYVEAPGTAPQQIEVRVPPEGEARVAFKLVPLPPPSGALVVRSDVDGALVRVDGEVSGFTPAVIDKVRAGTHKLEILAEGREPVSMTVEVRADERTPIDAHLRYALPRVEAAERILTRAQDAPASISVISSEEIRGFGYATLAEALRSVRGLFISSDRDYDSLGVRGYSVAGVYNNKVLVLADGHITNDLSLGQGFIGRDFDVDLNDVERIEIVRGPGSVLYGSAAFLAVVNVVHKTPPLGLHASGHATFLGEAGAGAVISAAAENRWVSLHGGVFRNEGETLFRSPMESGPYSGFATNLDGEESAHADLRARYGDFNFYGSVNDRGKSLPTAPFDTVFGLPGTATHDSRFFGELSWAHTFGWGGSLDARVSLDGRRHSATYQYRGPSDSLGHPGTSGRIADWGEAEVRLRLPEILRNRIFVGAEAQDVWKVRLSSFTPAGSDAGLSQAPDVNYSETVYSAYAGDDLRIGQRLQLDAAVRVDDHHDSFGTTANPRLALIAQPWDGGNFKLMYGTAYRAPSFYERYYQNGTTQVAGNRCNPDGTCTSLKPEEIRTGEFELSHAIGESTSLLVAGYWSRISKILRLTGSGPIFFGNRGSITHTAGIEGEARWQPEPGALVAVWYAFAHVVNDQVCTAGRCVPGFIVPNVPTHTAALRMLWPVLPGMLSVSSELIYGSSRYTVFVDNNNLETPVGEQFIWNAGLTGALGRGGPRFTLLVQNLLDQKPLLPAGLEVPFAPRAVPQVGRTFRATLGGSF